VNGFERVALRRGNVTRCGVLIVLPTCAFWSPCTKILRSKQEVLGDGYCVKLAEISDLTPGFSRDKLHSKSEITYFLYHIPIENIYSL
jgi:hypothetical protein